jgi:diaminopimelate epimerase
MMSYKFTKMHGIGNDYIYFDCTKEALPSPELAAIPLSDRHFGIGSDGIVLIEPAEEPSLNHFKMRMFNADGSEAEMCGNAVRCVAKFIFEKGLSPEKIIKLETKAGVKTLFLEVNDDSSVSYVKVNMGEAIYRPDLIPCLFDSNPVLNEKITIGKESFTVNAVSMGNPHCVIFVDEITDYLVHTIGPQIETHEMFPKKVNVEFGKIISESTVEMRVWERGSGETLACGTGACAMVAIGHSLGLLSSKTQVNLLGGTLKIEIDSNNTIWMTGPAAIAFEGTVKHCW